MARQVVYVDDIDGSEDASTVQFTVHGQSYEIDLGPANRELFDKALAQFVNAARKGEAVVHVSEARRTATTTRHRPGQGQSREQGQAIREWGRKNGFQVSERGRIPNPLQQAYDQAHQGKAAGLAASMPGLSAKVVRPPLPTAEQLAEVHEQSQPKPQPKPAPPAALFSAPEVKGEGNSGGNEADSGSEGIETIEVTSAGVKAWMESKGMPTDGVKFLARLGAFKKGHPGVKVKYIKDDEAKAS